MRTYRQVYKLGIKKSFEYGINFYMGLISVVFPIIIQFYLWSGLFSASENKIVFGYTFFQMFSYSVFAALTTKIIGTDFVYSILSDIKEGGLSKYLVRPVSYFKYNLSGYLGEKTGVILSSCILILFVWCGINFISKSPLYIIRLLCFFSALVLGLILNFLIFYGISSLGFWMIDSSGVVFITSLVGTIVSGGIFPLDIFSRQIQALLHLFPFPYTSYFPVSILCGTLSAAEIVEGFILQLIWILVCSAIGNILWKIGIKHYVSIGG